MANIDNVQLPDGSSYNIVDNTSGFATQNYVDSAVSSVTKTTIGLGNVDNTSDLNKPISTATQTALDTLDEDKAEKTDIAPVEDSSTASASHATGSQFYFNGQLVTATANINAGGTITLGGNCAVSDTLTEQIGNISKDWELLATVNANDSNFPLNNSALNYRMFNIILYGGGYVLESALIVKDTMFLSNYWKRVFYNVEAFADVKLTDNTHVNVQIVGSVGINIYGLK